MVSDTVAVAVADGHGTSRHGDVGARLAVQVTLAALVRFTEDLGERASDPVEVRKYAEHPLRTQIVREWRERVRAKAESDDPQFLEYGSTVLAAVATSDFLLLGQLGDGDILLVDEDGTVNVPLPADPASFADETHSLCLPEAEHAFRVRVLPAPERESLLLLSTDGYGKSYSTDADFKQIGPGYLQLVREHGISGLAPLLRGFLTEVTTQGSGDDIAFALLHWPAPASRTATDSPAALSDSAPLPERAGAASPDTAAKDGHGSLLPREPEASECRLVSPPDSGGTNARRSRTDSDEDGRIFERGYWAAGCRFLQSLRAAVGKLRGNRNEFTK